MQGKTDTMFELTMPFSMGSASSSTSGGISDQPPRPRPPVRSSVRSPGKSNVQRSMAKLKMLCANLGARTHTQGKNIKDRRISWQVLAIVHDKSRASVRFLRLVILGSQDTLIHLQVSQSTCPCPFSHLTMAASRRSSVGVIARNRAGADT